MKKLMIIAILISGLTFLTSFNLVNKIETEKAEEVVLSDYCEGWEDGYCEGWKDVKGSYAICPITPICPIAEIGKDSYKGGYNRGFKAGMAAAKK